MQDNMHTFSPKTKQKPIATNISLPSLVYWITVFVASSAQHETNGPEIGWTLFRYLHVLPKNKAYLFHWFWQRKRQQAFALFFRFVLTQPPAHQLEDFSFNGLWALCVSNRVYSVMLQQPQTLVSWAFKNYCCVCVRALLALSHFPMDFFVFDYYLGSLFTAIVAANTTGGRIIFLIIWSHLSPIPTVFYFIVYAVEMYEFSVGAIPPKLEQGRLSLFLPAITKVKNEFTPHGFTPILGLYVARRENQRQRRKASYSFAVQQQQQ